MSDETDARRLHKAQEIIASGGVVQVGPGTWRVTSQPGFGHHVVSRIGANGTAALACTCPDWTGRNDLEAGLSLSACKHVLAVETLCGGNGRVPEDANEGSGAMPFDDQVVDHPTDEDEEEVEAEIRECRHEQQADIILWTIGVLEEQIEQVEALARQESAVIESWRASEVGRLHQRIQDLSGLLGGFMRHKDRKTLHLPHGELRLRAMPDRITINAAEFRLDRTEFVRVIPEQRVPDLQKIKAHLKATGEIPDGVGIEPQAPKFTYLTMRQKLQSQKESEVKKDREYPQAAAADD